MGGKYLIVPPGYDGPLPEGGYFVAHSKTNRVLYASPRLPRRQRPEARCRERSRPAPKIYPYEPGGYGTSIAQALEGKVRLAGARTAGDDVRSRAPASLNTIPPSDSGFFEMLNANRAGGAGHVLDPELMGQLAAIGIVKGKPFEPDERMKKILTEAAAVGNATSRSLFCIRVIPSWFYYPGLGVGATTCSRPAPLRDPAAGSHPRASSPSRRPAPAHSMPARPSSTATPASRQP